MKILHITKLPDGGASWCAMRISEALIKHGIDSKILLMQGNPNCNIYIAKADFLYAKYNNLFIRIIMKVLRLIFRPKFERLTVLRKKAGKTSGVFFTSPITGYTNIVNSSIVKEADIIHLHWISDFVDLPSFFRKINKPVVWTIHDENPGLGGFHYELHKQGASKEYLKLDKEYENIKRKAINGTNRPYLVAISRQMFDFFKGNMILKECPITVINNGVNETLFHPFDRQESKKELNIPFKKKVFLFSSYQIEDKRKGLHFLIPALEMIKDDNILLICLGKFNSIPASKKIEIRCTGLIKDSETLSKYYSSADFFVLSSFQEAFAQTPLEAMSCGTPVIAFPCSGTEDLINERNGMITNDFTIEALSETIEKALNKQFDRKEIRKDVMSRFSYDIIACKYIKLYRDILKPC